MEKLFWKECVKMKNKNVSSYIYFKKKRFILLVSIVSFVVTILVVIGVVLIAMGLFHQEDSMSTLNLGNVEVEKAESVNQKEAEESNGFLLDVPYLSQEGEYPTACEVVSAANINKQIVAVSFTNRISILTVNFVIFAFSTTTTLLSLILCLSFSFCCSS